jgi:hypothetical protein
MRGVVDTNQAARLPLQYMFTGTNQVRKQITLPPLVLGELLLRATPQPTFDRLKGFDIQCGLDLGDTMRTISRLDEAEMLKFKPFVNLAFNKPYERLYSALDVVRPVHTDWARKMKEGHLQFCGGMYDRAVVVREQLRRRSEAGIERFGTFGDAVRQLPSFRELVVTSITNGGQRQSRIADAAVLYDSVMRNPFLRRLWNSILFFLVSWSRQWQEQRLNFDPAATRDDWVDMTLPLYAAEGDVILTADSKVKLILEMVEPTGAVTAMNADNF